MGIPNKEGRIHFNVHQSFYPIFNAPFADLFSLHLHNQNNQCSMFELNYYRCMKAFGFNMGIRHCDLERRDYYECLTCIKQVANRIRHVIGDPGGGGV